MKQKNPTGKQYAPSVAAAIGVFGIGAFPQLKMHDPIPPACGTVSLWSRLGRTPAAGPLGGS